MHVNLFHLRRTLREVRDQSSAHHRTDTRPTLRLGAALKFQALRVLIFRVVLASDASAPPQSNAAVQTLSERLVFRLGRLTSAGFQCSSGLMAGSLSTTSLVACQYGCRL